jgi:FtsZ-binding cell division protein ZapB
MAYLEGLHKEQAELTKAIEAVEPLTSDEAATLNTTGREMQKMRRSREDLEATIAELKREQPDPQDAIDSALVRAWATMESLGVNPEPAAATA